MSWMIIGSTDENEGHTIGIDTVWIRATASEGKVEELGELGEGEKVSYELAACVRVWH